VSLKSTDEKYQKIPIQDLGEPLKLKTFIIPYSKFSKTEKFIYYGYEKIPFHERHPVYQTLLKKEFADGIKIFLKNFRK
jgi:hypothetical protein